MNLPQDFTNRMQKLLGDEAHAFFASYEKEKSYGLRVNPLKYDKTKKNRPYELNPAS